jgi:hypothetical protein
MGETSTSTITIASLASVIGLGILKMFLNSKGIRFSFSAKIGNSSPTISLEDAPTRQSFSKKRSLSVP